MSTQFMRQLFARWAFFEPPASRREPRAGAHVADTPGSAPTGHAPTDPTQTTPESPLATAGRGAVAVAGNDSTRTAARLYLPVWVVTLVAVGILLLYWSTAVSIVAIWWRSETFAHGFIVVPICFWLAWRERETLRQIDARPWWPGIVIVFAAGALWFVASAADALGVKQFALAFLIQAAIVTIAGTRVARALAFPLIFLLFAVPAGEFLVPTFIDWTADFTVNALRLSGVPVYREANQFIIPSGAWSVVDACSGLRYLIASVMVGTLYAAIAYRSTRRRVAFVAASILVPIVANWLRAYMVVMLGHLSNNQLASGVDHIIYGWIFFGIVMLLLFWVGSLWQEEPLAARSAANASPIADPLETAGTSPLRLFAAAIVVLATAAVWPPIDSVVAQAGNTGTPQLHAVAGGNGWTSSDAPLTAWKPRYRGYAAELSQTFRKDERAVGLYLAFYRDQLKGRELVTSGNMLVIPDDSKWKPMAVGSDSVEWVGSPVSVHRAALSGRDVGLEIFRLYWVNGTVTASEYVAKALTAWSRLRGRGDDSALIVIYTTKPAPDKDVRDVLREFAASMSPAIERTLEAAHGASR